MTPDRPDDELPTTVYDPTTKVVLRPAPAVAPAPAPSSALTVVSMKSPVPLDAAPRAPVVPVPRLVKLRAIAELDGLTGPPQKPTGNLAPPRDETRARRRGVRSLIGWSLAALVLAGLVSAAIYFVSTR